MNKLENLDSLIEFTESELKKALEEYKKINKSNIKRIVIMDEIIKYETSLKRYYNQKQKEN